MKGIPLHRVSNPGGKWFDYLWGRSELFLFVFACLLGALVGSIYAFLIPAFLPGFKSGWIMGLGALGSALLCGLTGIRSRETKPSLMAVVVGLLYAAVGVIVFYFVSLFIILNYRGS